MELHIIGQKIEKLEAEIDHEQEMYIAYMEIEPNENARKKARTISEYIVNSRKRVIWKLNKQRQKA